MIYGYVAKELHTSELLMSAVENYCLKYKLVPDQVIVDYENNGANWDERRLTDLIETQCRAGDVIILHDAVSIGRSVSRVLDVLITLVRKQVTVHFVKYNIIFDTEAAMDVNKVKKLPLNIERDFIAGYNNAATVCDGTDKPSLRTMESRRRR